MLKYKLLLFDLDGTLVNSMFDLGDALNHTLDFFGKSPIPYERIPAMVGGGVRALLVNGFGSDENMDQIQQVFNDYYTANYVVKTKPYPDVIAALKQLDTFQKGVYSNKPHPLTTGIITALDMDQYFQYVQGARPALYKRKPAKEGVLYAIEALGSTPEETLFIGDSTHDIHAGQAAGVDTCAVTYGYRSKEILLAEKPNFMIDSLLELNDLV